KHEVRFHQSRLVHDFIYQGVISVLQETGAEALPDVSSAPAERWQPENRQAAGGNHFSEPAPAALRAAPTDQGSRAGNRWQRQEPQYQKREGAVYQQLLKTGEVSSAPAVRDEPPPETRVKEEKPAPLAGHVHSFGRVLTVIQEQYALVDGSSGVALIALAVAERWLKQMQL
ncbi:MAG TPA: DNA mismatch repair protein MutL, partial [Erwinia persicina]|nr:DNA mismatch repair protein MutL [Erwinia persicina]